MMHKGRKIFKIVPEVIELFRRLILNCYRFLDSQPLGYSSSLNNSILQAFLTNSTRLGETTFLHR